MRTRSVLVASLLLVPALAGAEVTVRELKAPGTAAYGEIVAGPRTVDDLQFARQVLPPSAAAGQTPGVVALVAQSKTIYLNKNGVTLTPGNNDSRTNKSTIASQQTTIAPWNVSATTWSATVACMKDLFSAYNVTVTETDPGATPHIEAVFGGSPTQLGLPTNVAGVSPFTTDCQIIENSIVFTFTNVIPADARLACEIMAQEVAHSYGLDHELLASDPMTYLDYTGNRSFKNQTASCGEDVTRPCGINGSTCRANQNSVALLTERLGAKTGDTVAPTASISSPANNTTVPPGFSVVVDAADNVAVTSAKLYLDGALADTKTGGPFTFTTASTIAEGVHKLKIEVADAANNVVQTQELTVTVKKGAPSPTGPGSNDPGGADGAEITGGCAATGGGSGLGGLLALGLVGLARRRRR